ncbi:unnamed protein product [Paramecium octaurelia]|uniref:B30.2/SPRY domain-containing protein n=1 Tax=Paramecium octaurelia TaxID=43137 RepID=A0A8S1UL18_PAROT|nr:unnamed protein product [Paramecium octaurelia]
MNKINFIYIMICKIECQIHKGEKLSAICVDSYCVANTQCCPLCIKESHNVHEHKVVSLISLQSFISDQENIKRQNLEFNSVKQQLIANRLQLAELTEMIDAKIEKLNKNQLGFNLSIDQLMTLDSEELPVLKILLNQYEIQNNMIVGIDQQIKSKMEMQISQLLSQINILTTEYTKKISQTLSKLSVEQFKEELKFSEVNKHKHIQLNEGRTATLTQQIGYAVIYSEQSFDPTKESFKCSFLINNLSYGLVGFGSLEASKTMQYQIYDFSKGHGFYALHNTGVIYHSDDPAINNTKIKPLSFDKADSVVCYYDAQSQSFTFFKESNKNEKYTMKHIDPSKKLYPVAILFGPGDSISFI